MIVYVLFVHKKSVSKIKVFIIFIKNEKFKKKTKKTKKKHFQWVFMGFLGGFFIANPAQDDKGEEVGGEFDAAREDEVEIFVAVQVGDVVGDPVVAERDREPDEEEDERPETDGRHPGGKEKNVV